MIYTSTKLKRHGPIFQAPKPTDHLNEAGRRSPVSTRRGGIRATPNAEAEVHAITDLDLDGLRTVWRQRYGSVPKLRSVELLRLMLAWRIQAEVFGGLDPALRRELSRSGPIERDGQNLGQGAILRRIWAGRAIEAIVVEDGFSWNGQVYSSLSAIAEAATGTRWNGPRFFGLRKGQTP